MIAVTAASNARALGHAPQAAAGSRSARRPAAMITASSSAASAGHHLAAPRFGSLRSISQARVTFDSCLLAKACSIRGAAVATIQASSIAPGSVSVVLLAGGVGKRMGANMPKQYLPLKGTPICLWSLKTFATMEEVGEVVVVCGEDYRSVFEGQSGDKPMKFALPGAERQDSVFNGLSEISDSAALVAVHDSARPCVTVEEVRACLADAEEHGAAVLGVPCKATIKSAGKDRMVVETLDRSTLWEMHTPQIIVPSVLKEGFAYVKENNLEVTDDVSIVEHLGKPVKITEGTYNNLKVTTPEDLITAEKILGGEGVALASA